MNKRTWMNSTRRDVGDKAETKAVWSVFPGLLLSLCHRQTTIPELMKRAVLSVVNSAADNAVKSGVNYGLTRGVN